MTNPATKQRRSSHAETDAEKSIEQCFKEQACADETQEEVTITPPSGKVPLGGVGKNP